MKILESSLKNYGFCPSRYLSPLALIWDSMLNVTKVELELIPLNMMVLLEKGMRGGVSYISIDIAKLRISI